MRSFIIALILAGLWTVTAQAQTMEFTPGPRMIRAVEQVSQEYRKLDKTLGITAGQQRAMSELIQEFKKEMWLKEAVLVGMFLELEEKRRYGLLKENEYRTANVLTAGIETDELNLLIRTLRSLQGILTEQQRVKLERAWRSTLTFSVPQGFTTKIALLSLKGIGRTYDSYRDELHLADPQATALRSLLEAARAELLQMGTAIDINRTEAYDLLKGPLIDPEVVRTKMQKTGDMEGVLFNKLFELSDRVKGLLTEKQRETLRELKHARHIQATGLRQNRTGQTTSSHADHERAPETLESFRFFLDQIKTVGLTREQVAELVALKNQTKNTHLFDHARLKGMELELFNLIHRIAREDELPEGQMDEKIHQIEQARAKHTQVQVMAYLKARRILTEEQERRIRPVAALGSTP